MLDKFIYENNLGQRFSGLENGVYLNYSDLRDYSWSYDTMNSRISRFYRSITDRKLPLVVVGKSEDEAVAVKNKLSELAEIDIEAMIPGKIFVGDYYTNGYITASAKSDYLLTKRYCKIDFTLTSDDPFWYRERLHTFLPESGSIVGVGEGTDYPYDYAYDYATMSKSGKNIVCDSVRSNAFKLLIHGSVSNPSVTIGNHVYSVNGTIGTGETLLIDSLSKKITLTTVTGQKINWFDNRSRDSYIFEPIPAGQHSVNWNGAFGFDLTVIEKRSEPRWT